MKQVYDLNGYWEFSPVLDQRPENNHSLTTWDVPLYASPALCRRHWERVEVPGVFQRYGECYRFFEGVAWYCRRFSISRLGDRAVLSFGGVLYRAEVYLNGRLVGTHESGYTPFSFDVTDFLQEGENFIAVSVDNRPLIVKWPNDWGYMNFGGIHRDVALTVCDERYLSFVSLTPSYDSSSGEGLLALSLQVKGGRELSVSCAGERAVLLADDAGRVETMLRLPGVSPWSPDSPTLYDLEICIDGELFECRRVGFRSFCVQNGKTYLNGEEIFLRGACYVYDSPKYGLVMRREEILHDLSEMKRAGCNAIRTHYPMSESFYALTDELGFLVWIEPNIYCSKPQESEADTVFKRKEHVEIARQMTREMIEGAREHASVAVYGIGNECNVEHREALPFFRSIAALIRQEDPTRPLGYAALYEMVGEMGELVDIMGINSYFAWYGRISDLYEYSPRRDGDEAPLNVPDMRELRELLARVSLRIPNRVALYLTEFGADSIPGYFSSSCDLWSEDYHAAVISAVLGEAAATPRISGTFVFAFTDYDDPSKPRNGYWNGRNLKGVLSYHRVRKLAFEALRETYSAWSGRERE